MLSINAVVSATHLGASGAGLKVIAGAIRELRMESESRSGDARAALHSLGAAIASLTASTGTAGRENARALLLENLNTRVRNLQSASEGSLAASASASTQVDSLCADLLKVRENFRVGGLFAATAAHCCHLLDRVACQAAPASSGDALLDETHYTMESERAIHRGALAHEEPEADEVEFF